MGLNPPASRIPLWLKLTYTGFLAVLVPVYLYLYGPTNFLFFCDVALFLALIAIWTEHPLPAGMAAVGIILPQTLWVIDFVCGFFGLHPFGLATYMFHFENAFELFTRGLSLFHGWLPFLLIYLVWRLGYDVRSLAAWTVLAWVLLTVSYLYLPPPAPGLDPNVPANVNAVYGLSSNEPQTWMPANAWFAVMMLGLPVLFFIPTHFLLRWTCPRPCLV
jgi:hypothetical protein